MAQEIKAWTKVPDNVDEIGCKALKDKGYEGLLEVVVKIILHAMVDDPYYADLRAACEVNVAAPEDSQKANIEARLQAESWECILLGRASHASVMGRANIIADCHGMTLSEYLAHCMHCGLEAMERHAENPNAQDFPEVFP